MGGGGVEESPVLSPAAGPERRQAAGAQRAGAGPVLVPLGARAMRAGRPGGGGGGGGARPRSAPHRPARPGPATSARGGRGRRERSGPPT